MEVENIMNKIQNYLGNAPENLTVLEEQIDIELQMEYFDLSGEVKKNINKDKVLSEKDMIFLNDISLDEKKELLCKLASVEDVAAYRTLEKYLKQSPQDIYKWAFLALQESKMLLESSFLDENRVFISTGLGGKGRKLRYNVVFLSNQKTAINEIQKKVIINESDQILKQLNCENEKINFYENYASLIILIPLEVDLKFIFRKIIDECNIYGNFLNKNFIITNVKILNDNEIQNIINKKTIDYTD